MAAPNISFTLMDKNSDGSIDVDELSDILKTVGHGRKISSVQRMMEGMDVNKDGKIDQDEFIKHHQNRDKVLTAFKMWDKDDDGKITATEIQRMSTELGEPLTDVQTDELIRNHDEDGDGRIKIEEFRKMMKNLNPGDSINHQVTTFLPPSVGVSDLWQKVDHVALVVSDVGRSAAFYRLKLGMTQIPRPDFDRHGAWFTMGNINLHLIKGRPAVHLDDDLIVSHIAINVGTDDDMKSLIERLDTLEVAYRENISVPNPGDGGPDRVKQAFVRDPDGYYLEFCSCAPLEEYLEKKRVEYETVWDMYRTSIAVEMKAKIAAWKADHCKGTKQPVDSEKLENLMKRQKIFGDITQTASKEQLEDLLSICENDIPSVMLCLKAFTVKTGGQIFIPPAFFDRDSGHTFIQPPSFKMGSHRQ